MAWTQIIITMKVITLEDETKVESLEELLLENHALSITIEDNANQPLFAEILNETPIWQHCKITVLFNDNINVNRIIALIYEKFESAIVNNIIVEKVEDKNWQLESQKNFIPLIFGKKLCVCPGWNTPPKDVEVVVKLNPGMAFGTGTHQTTRLCLEWLIDNVAKNDTIIDYGCGSGILAIGALKLGAKHAYAIDYDHQALTSTKLNATLNNIPNDHIHCLLPSEIPKNTEATIVIANILANPLCELSETLANLVGKNGKLVLSGILDTQIELILNTYNKYFKNHKVSLIDEWVRIEFS